MSGLLSSKLMGMARNAEYKINAFPDFGSALNDLRHYQRAPQPEYEVCVATGDGQLIVRESLIEFWSKKHPEFEEQLQKVMESHNAEFNPRGLKRGAEEQQPEGEDDSGRPTKRLCLDSSVTAEKFEEQCSERKGFKNFRVC